MKSLSAPRVLRSICGISAAVALTMCAWAVLPAETALMPLDEVKAGMIGTGQTVFQGTELQEFKVHILGVLRNVQGPRRSLILAKLEGGPLADTGVIAGMSGSPVYIDGRLIGAVSYSIGQFAKEPIAGITPIAEMIEATAETSRRATVAQARVELPLTTESFATAVRQTSARLGSFADRAVDIGGVGLTAAAGGPMAGTLRPIATPLIMSGMSAATRDLVSSIFSNAGFAPMLAGSSGGADTPKPSGPLRPGDAVGVSLLGGDADMGATGTVTHVDGTRVYAFGHPFFNLGPTAFPMTRAYIYTSLPSLMSSFKIASLGDVIGSVQQDRATAIAGHARTRSTGHPHQPHARLRPRTQPHLSLQRRRRPAVHASVDLRRLVQHPGQLRTTIRRGHLYGERQGGPGRAHRLELRGHLHGRQSDCWRVGLRGWASDDAARQRPGAGFGEEHRSDRFLV